MLRSVTNYAISGHIQQKKSTDYQPIEVKGATSQRCAIPIINQRIHPMALSANIP